jgi:nucleotide-binding universal stress UspA family protein
MRLGAHAFRALSLALAVAKDNMVCIEETPNVPSELVGEVNEMRAAVHHRFHNVIRRARSMAEKSQVHLHAHITAGPPREIVTLAAEFDADLLVIEAKGHSALYERMIGSRANRIMQLAPMSGARCKMIALSSTQ